MFFSNAGVELVKAGTVLQEEVYLEDDGDFKAIDGGSGLFLDHETKLTHGFVSIQCESEAQVL